MEIPTDVRTATDVNPDMNGIGNTSDPNVIGESTANMQMAGTFTDAGWDFVGEIVNGANDIWTILEGDYPRLWWEERILPETKKVVSMVKNGSFEDDGREIDPVTPEDAPEYWWDVNIPSDKFIGWVDTFWWSHSYVEDDGNSLAFSSKSYVDYVEGDMASASQEVYLLGVKEIIFDIKLNGTHSSYQWESARFSAVVQIDGNDVWDSKDWRPDGNELLPDEDAMYYDVNVPVAINDYNLHTLTLAMRANSSQAHYTQYRVYWDFVKFDKYCGGFGYLRGDFNRDCYVDFRDFALLAGLWMEQTSDYNYDLFEDGVVDGFDLMLFVESWAGNSDWRNWGDENCYELSLLDADLNDDGVVNLRDYAILVSQWESTEEHIRADLGGNGVVGYDDILVLGEYWLEKSWLYWQDE